MVVYVLSGLFVGVAGCGMGCGALACDWEAGLVGWVVGGLAFGILSSIAGILVGKYAATFKGAFSRWFFGFVLGVLGAAIVAALLGGAAQLDLKKWLLDPLMASLDVIGGIVCATTNCLLYCADQKGTRKKVLRTIARCVTVSTLGVMALWTVFLIIQFLNSRTINSPAWLAVLTVTFCALGVNLGALLSTLYCREDLTAEVE